jgi:hypothetical protein
VELLQRGSCQSRASPLIRAQSFSWFEQGVAQGFPTGVTSASMVLVCPRGSLLGVFQTNIPPAISLNCIKRIVLSPRHTDPGFLRCCLMDHRAKVPRMRRDTQLPIEILPFIIVFLSLSTALPSKVAFRRLPISHKSYHIHPNPLQARSSKLVP